jgi:diguanylate cyclase (GGDEF)-like protein
MLADVISLLDNRTVMLTGSMSAFFISGFLAIQIKSVRPYGRPLIFESCAQLFLAFALLNAALIMTDFSLNFTWRVLLPATIGYALGLASILLLQYPTFPLKIVFSGTTLVLLGYLVWPEGMAARILNNSVQLVLAATTVYILLRSKDNYAPKARILNLVLCVIFAIGVVPRLVTILNSPTDLSLAPTYMNTESFKLGVLVMCFMPVLKYASILGTIHARIAAMLRESVHRDLMTGAYSRGYLFDNGSVIVQPSMATVLMIDVDHFKQFNDSWGHQVGDQVLRHCVNQIKQVIRQSDAIVCRYGGEEFCVLIPAMPLESAALLSERIRSHVAENPFEHKGEKLPLTISIGVAQQGGQSTLAALIECADERLYIAKRTGRNRVVLNHTQAIPPAI